MRNFICGYDEVLQSGVCTDNAPLRWTRVAGWYTGHPYCTRQNRSEDGMTWYRQRPDLGPGQHFIGATTSYDLYPWKCFVDA